MSLLSTVQQAIKSCKDEQTRLSDSIQLLRELLQSLTLHPKAGFEESELADDTVADGDASTGEKEDMELLERALEKALQVRHGSEPAKKDSSVDVLRPSTACKGRQTAIKSTSRLASLDRKESKKSGLSDCTTLSSRPSASSKPVKSKNRNDKNVTQNQPSYSARAVHHRASGKLQQALSASVSPDQITASPSKNKTVRGNMLSDDDPSKAASVSVPFSDTDGSEASNLLQRDGLPTEQTTKWKSLRRKQNRLLEKVIALQRKPVTGRCHFMERMRATFPKDWPYGSPNQTRTLLDRVTHQGLDLVWRCQAEENLVKQASAMSTELGCKQNDSCLTLERLQLTAVELQSLANQVQLEWKAWNRWSPEGGCLCPSGSNGVWGDGKTSALPLTIIYRAEAELQELERLRIRVELLQQEIYLEQVLWDTLSPHFSSLVPGPGRPNPTLLRDVYSLLGEGGERFPAIVLDSEPE
ncbi:uncharacterized protein tedc2 isoform 1-T2 [Odontesthes bonariensis]|uniref:uncharacterized protein tedc2 n=1 Tax=Odontesthes bonariensis TaxID=219752 RepID=UPI003F585F37